MSRLSSLRKWITAVVAASLLAAALPAGQARAGLVGTEQVVQSIAAQQDRDRLRGFMLRDDVRSQMVALGVDPAEASARIDGLTEEEIARIVGEIDQLPAGQDAAVVIISGALAVLLILILTDILGYTDVFSFVDPAEE